MHIPDNYLSPQTCAVMTAAMLPVWTISVRRIQRELTEENVPIGQKGAVPLTAAKRLSMLGVAAAFSFLGMMFNIPLPGGTTGHAVGGTLLALLVGPYGACISISTALLLQALLFGDGGILAFGANCFNMAFVMPFVGYGIYRLIAAAAEKSEAGSDVKGKIRRRRLTGAAVGSYAGINAAALCAAIEFGIQPMLFRDAAGAPSYCPYPLSVSIPAMMAGHLTIFGMAEVVYTIAVYLFLARTAPSVLYTESDVSGSIDRINKADKSQNGRAGHLGERYGTGILLGLLIVLTPLGLLAEGTAWGEWGADEIADSGAGFTPSGMLQGFSFESLLPDYSFGNMPAAAGYVLSAVLGVSVLLIVFKLLAGGVGRKKKES